MGAETDGTTPEEQEHTGRPPAGGPAPTRTRPGADSGTAERDAARPEPAGAPPRRDDAPSPTKDPAEDRAGQPPVVPGDDATTPGRGEQADLPTTTGTTAAKDAPAAERPASAEAEKQPRPAVDAPEPDREGSPPAGEAAGGQTRSTEARTPDAAPAASPAQAPDRPAAQAPDRPADPDRDRTAPAAGAPARRQAPDGPAGTPSSPQEPSRPSPSPDGTAQELAAATPSATADAGSPRGARGDQDHAGRSQPRTDAVPGPSPLRVLVSPRLTRGTFLAGLLALLLGFATVTQVRQTRASGLEDLRQSELVGVLGDVNNQAARLQAEAEELERTRDRLRSGSDGAAAEAEARQRLETLGVLAGTVRATGPGVRIEVNDPERGTTAPNLLDAVQELRNAGAEALQINDVRVVASTWVGTADDGRLVIDGTPVDPPYRIVAIGDPHTLSTAMAIPGGVVENLRRSGADAVVSEHRELSVTALRPLSGGGYARPTRAG